MAKHRSHMKKFNIAYTHAVVIKGLRLPKGSFYGKDAQGYWYTTDRNPNKNIETPSLYVWRYCEDLQDWRKFFEQGDLVTYIINVCSKITVKAPYKTIWDIPVSYPERNKRLNDYEMIASEAFNIHHSHKRSGTMKRSGMYHASQRVNNANMLKLCVGEQGGMYKTSLLDNTGFDTDKTIFVMNYNNEYNKTLKSLNTTRR